MTDHAFHQLMIERRRTLFMLYGFHWVEHPDDGGVFIKQANSLSEALLDLQENPGVLDEGGFVVTDAFLQEDDGVPTVHVELRSVREMVQQALESEES